MGHQGAAGRTSNHACWAGPTHGDPPVSLAPVTRLLPSTTHRHASLPAGGPRACRRACQVPPINVFRNMARNVGNHYEDVLYKGIDVDIEQLVAALRRWGEAVLAAAVLRWASSH